jgi:branched-chain amino acid transport system permease protein
VATTAAPSSAAVIWGLWSFSDVLTAKLPAPLDTRGSYLRVMLIGLVLQGILLKRPRALFQNTDRR